ncbi:amino acid ABC transporter permease [Saxibacter everestensis]|uniref:Amino acid ABC transporter permease n=1 Tax=Saxibacter everestensis TaxID=2909229 RepID=A0ABY8QVB3_9MICO|nr:amino acid ABC transporter permease [Brevibacteriaceae bacterium ZFBP1038]
METSDLVALFASGFWGTIKLAFLTLIGSLIFGTVLAAMRVSPTPILRGAATAYINLVRNTPLTLVMFFCAFGLPYLDIRFGESTSTRAFYYAVLALTAYTSCFIAEAIRSGIATIAVGQAEASRAIGLTFGQSLRFIILPQAIRTVIPPLGNQIIAMVKNTSIASGFNNQELISAMKNTIEFRADIVIPVLCATAAAYLILSLGLGQVFRVLERKAAIVR